jgi:uncharacterized protein (DUF983 family)
MNYKMLPRCPQCGQEIPASALFRSSYKCEACDADLEMDNGAASRVFKTLCQPSSHHRLI